METTWMSKWRHSTVMRKACVDGYNDYKNGFDNRRSPSQILEWLDSVDLSRDLYDDYMVGYVDGVRCAITEKHDDEERTLRESHDGESSHVNSMLLTMLSPHGMVA